MTSLVMCAYNNIFIVTPLVNSHAHVCTCVPMNPDPTTRIARVTEHNNALSQLGRKIMESGSTGEKSSEASSILDHLKQLGSTMLKYDQTGEVLLASGLQSAAKPDECAGELGCSVLTPEQIYSQLSRVLHSGGNDAASAAGARATVAENEGTRKDAAGADDATAKLTSSSSSRKPLKRRTREKKNRKVEQPKRAKAVENGIGKCEKRPRRRLRQTRSRSLEEKSAPIVNNDSRPPLTLTRPSHHVHVVEISPEKNPISLEPSRPTPSTVAMETTFPIAVAKESPSDNDSSDLIEDTRMETSHTMLDCDNNMSVTKATSTVTSLKTPSPYTVVNSNKTTVVSMATNRSRSHDNSINYELLGRLIGEPILTSFYQSFHGHPMSEHLKIELLDPLVNNSGCLIKEVENLPRWLQVTQKRMHIDPHLGPITLARILLSNAGIIKFQHLFPVTQTVFMQHIHSCNLTKILSELSRRHVLCPGLPNYSQNHVALGYHPSDVRMSQTQISPNVLRYDHCKCPILHVPRSSQSSQDSVVYADNMCTKCTQLNSFIMRLIWDKYTRVQSSNLEKQCLAFNKSPGHSHSDKNDNHSPISAHTTTASQQPTATSTFVTKICTYILYTYMAIDMCIYILYASMGDTVCIQCMYM